uniref:glutamine--fructose-6-phosphate transaminase (isomerizing) n=1 Tax=Florenciella sp. virus SA2 TaxID=3240092 RepID=A0AB39JG14_9VIRU
MLIKYGVTFKSETDSETIINLISYFSKNSTIIESVQKAIDVMEGTYGVVIMDKNDMNSLYVLRKGSPILIGKTKDYLIVTSEINGFYNKVNNYMVVNDNSIIKITYENDNFSIIQCNTEEQDLNWKSIEKNILKLTPDPYAHWTHKEILEQPLSIMRTLNFGGRIPLTNKVKLGGLEHYKDKILNVKKLIILGCGTSLNAAKIGKSYFQLLSKIENIHVFDGAEFTQEDLANEKDTALLLLSQSGETLDLYRCFDYTKNALVISIVNTVDSLIARESQCGIYLNAGREVGVASTKSFSCQIIALVLMSIWISQNKNKNLKLCENIIDTIRALPMNIEEVFNNDSIIENVKIIAEYLKSHPSCFVIGKGINQYIADEGALKLKEIGYIHAEGYSSSSLKHGPFGLLTPGFPVIVLTTNDNNYSKVENAINELKSRNAKVFTIGDHSSSFIRVPENKYIGYLLNAIILQLVAYNLSLVKNINPDFPRNLAKVVTVE